MLTLTRCAVIVPVMRRPHAAARFMATMNQPNATVYAVTDPDDHATRHAWADTGAAVLTSDRGHTFAQKVNYGYRHTTEPWLLFVGDDVRFSPGWLPAAVKAAGTRHHVVSTNDLSRKDASKLALHPLVRRSYIDEEGMSLDGPGWVAHEGYQHWYVDREWSEVALARGILTYCPDAVIEHLHYLSGKSKYDAVYDLAIDHIVADGELWRRRQALLRPTGVS